MQQINLADPSLLPPRRGLGGALTLGLALAALALLAGHGAIEQRLLARALQASTTAPAADEAAAPEAPDTDADALRERLAHRRALLGAADAVQSLPPDAASVLERVLAALPDTLWLSEVELHGARGLRLAGGALDAAALGAFARRLSDVPALRGLPIETLRLQVEAPDAAADPDAAAQPRRHRFVLAGVDGAPESAR
jgi:hypothetical protein